MNKKSRRYYVYLWEIVGHPDAGKVIFYEASPLQAKRFVLATINKENPNLDDYFHKRSHWPKKIRRSSLSGGWCYSGDMFILPLLNYDQEEWIHLYVRIDDLGKRRMK